MMLYSLILFLATVVEKGGSFIPGPWVTFVTLGKYKLAVEDDMVTNDRSVKYGGVLHERAALRALRHYFRDWGASG